MLQRISNVRLVSEDDLLREEVCALGSWLVGLVPGGIGIPNSEHSLLRIVAHCCALLPAPLGPRAYCDTRSPRREIDPKP